MRKSLDHTGQRFSRWLVIGRADRPTTRITKDYFWLCKCDCGTESIVAGGSLRSNSKGCRKCSAVSRRKEKGECSFNGLYLRYKHGATSRNLSFELTKEEFREIVIGNCHYCNSPPSNKYKGRTAYGEYIYSGIDRKDSDIGYNKINCVSCCAFCNRAKGDRPYSEFKNWLKILGKFNCE